MKGIKMKIAKYGDNYYGDVKEYKGIRNYATPNHVESIGKHKETGKGVFINGNSKSSYDIES